MQKAIVLGVAFLIIGLIVGYMIYGKVNNRYIPVTTLLGMDDNLGHDILKEFGINVNKMRGFDRIKKNILLFGIGGLAAGILLGFASTRNRRRR